MADTAPPRPNTMHSLIVFAIKTVIVAAVVTIALTILIDNLMDDVNDLVERRIAQLTGATKIHGHEFWARVEKNLDRAADPSNDLPPERQQKLLEDVRILANRARPFILEAEKAFSEQASQATAKEK
jgi:hypothetical protein